MEKLAAPWVACPWGGRMHEDGVQREQLVSQDGMYRYVLKRTWSDPARTAMLPVIHLKPYGADEDIDDEPVADAMAFARLRGYAGIKVCCLFPMRDEYGAPDVATWVGPKNHRYLEMLIKHAAFVGGGRREVLCDWGVLPSDLQQEAALVEKLMKEAGAKRLSLIT